MATKKKHKLQKAAMKPAGTAQDIFNRKREKNEIDLVGLLTGKFLDGVDEKTAAIFATHKDIVSVNELNPIAQRIIINRYLNNKLLMYRNVSGKNVSEIMMYVINDGSLSDWVELFNKVVLPYFIQENVIVKTTL